MDPVLRLWLFHHWMGDHRDNAELAKNHAYLLGSFWNSEAVQQMLNANVHESTDDEFEESLRMVKEGSISLDGLIPPSTNQPAPTRRKRRATLSKD
jgi:hypothetical protein